MSAQVKRFPADRMTPEQHAAWVKSDQWPALMPYGHSHTGGNLSTARAGLTSRVRRALTPRLRGGNHAQENTFCCSRRRAPADGLLCLERGGDYARAFADSGKRLFTH